MCAPSDIGLVDCSCWRATHSITFDNLSQVLLNYHKFSVFFVFFDSLFELFLFRSFLKKPFFLFPFEQVPKVKKVKKSKCPKISSKLT